MFVSEPWHSLINPNDIELPKEHSTYLEMLNDHPFLKEVAKKLGYKLVDHKLELYGSKIKK